MSNELVVVENLELVPFFTKGDQVQSILDRLTEEANSYASGDLGDLSVKKNRDAVKAMVTKFTKSKTYLEDKGKDLAAEYKAIPKIIDANRKLVKDTITELQKVVRKPLTDWEDEQARIKAEAEAAKAAEELAIQVENDHEMALLLNDKFNADAKAELDRIERERIAYEEELKAKAAEDARELAEKQAAEKQAAIEEQKQEAIRKEQRAILEKEQAQQREAQLKIDAENAEKQRVLDAENAEKKRLADIEIAKQQEIARQQAEQSRLAAEQKARDDNKDHRAAVNNKVASALMEFANLSEEQAVDAVKALVRKQIPHTELKY